MKLLRCSGLSTKEQAKETGGGGECILSFIFLFLYKEWYNSTNVLIWREWLKAKTDKVHWNYIEIQVLNTEPYIIIT